jgi:hypothetical protein
VFAQFVASPSYTIRICSQDSSACPGIANKCITNSSLTRNFVLLVGRKLHHISQKFRSLLAIFAHNLIDIADFHTNLTQERQDFYRNHITPPVPQRKIGKMVSRMTRYESPH